MLGGETIRWFRQFEPFAARIAMPGKKCLGNGGREHTQEAGPPAPAPLPDGPAAGVGRPGPGVGAIAAATPALCALRHALVGRGQAYATFAARLRLPSAARAAQAG